MLKSKRAANSCWVRPRRPRIAFMSISGGMWPIIGHINPDTAQKMDIRKRQYIKECGELRKEFEKLGGSVTWVPGETNLADLGYHVTKCTTKKRNREAASKNEK